jgi:hypothetical protein
MALMPTFGSAAGFCPTLPNQFGGPRFEVGLSVAGFSDPHLLHQLAGMVPRVELPRTVAGSKAATSEVFSLSIFAFAAPTCLSSLRLGRCQITVLRPSSIAVASAAKVSGVWPFSRFVTFLSFAEPTSSGVIAGRPAMPKSTGFAQHFSDKSVECPGQDQQIAGSSGGHVPEAYALGPPLLVGASLNVRVVRGADAEDRDREQVLRAVLNQARLGFGVPVMTGHSRPLAAWTVISETASCSASGRPSTWRTASSQFARISDVVDRSQMASRWLPIILAPEIETAGWQASSSVGDTQADPRDEPCQSAVGSAPDPRRVAQDRHRNRTDQRGQVHGRATRPAVPRLENISPQPR